MYVTGTYEQLAFLTKTVRWEGIDTVFFMHPNHAFYAGKGDRFIYLRTPIVFLKDIGLTKKSLLAYQSELHTAKRDYERVAEHNGGILGYEGKVVTLQGNRLYFDRMERNDYNFKAPPFDVISSEKTKELVNTYVKLFASSDAVSNFPHMKVDIGYVKQGVYYRVRDALKEWLESQGEEAPRILSKEMLTLAPDEERSSASVYAPDGNLIIESLRGVSVSPFDFKEEMPMRIFRFIEEVNETMMLDGLFTITFCNDGFLLIESRDKESNLLFLARMHKSTLSK